jgi:lysophospholipase L1-like esterase
VTGNADRNNWFVAHPRAAGWIVFLGCFLLVEGLARVAVAVGVMPYREYPTHRVPQFWAYIDPVVGIWRPPNHEWRHSEKCLDVVYRTNSFGARDRERTLRSVAPRRVIVLGDSLIEGYGLASESRLTDLMEASSGVEYLNFATSGGFGTIQQWLLYRERLARFDHSDVIVFILPANDFRDNNPASFSADVYRPFLRRAGDGFELYYPVPFADRYQADRTLGTIIKNAFDNNVYVANGLRQATRLLKTQFRRRDRPRVAESAYDRYTPDDLEVMLYALDQLAAAAPGRKVHLVTIPAPEDFYWAQHHGYRFRLVDELQRFARAHANTDYLDLLPALLADAAEHGRRYADYQLPCDWHWGPLGHDLAARTLLAAGL